MEFLHSAWSFLLAIALLIFVHEFGHFFVARLCGVKVLRFSLGFGKVLFSKRFGADRTEWALSAIPLGGYVKMLDEREGEVQPEEKVRAFNNQPLYKRSLIVLAGPVTNLLLAILIYWVVFIVGTRELVPVLGSVTENSPAALAGFVQGDTVSEVNGQKIRSWADVRWAVIDGGIDKGTISILTKNKSGLESLHKLNASSIQVAEGAPDPLKQLGLNPIQIPAILGAVVSGSAAERANLLQGDTILKVQGVSVNSFQELARHVAKYPSVPIEIELKRGSEILMVNAIPDAIEVAGEQQGRLGVKSGNSPEMVAATTVFVQDSPIHALSRAISLTWDTSVFSVKVMGKILTGQLSVRNITGPVTMADYAGQTAKMGFEVYFKFLALISISLGVLNLMPIPVLDGGHLLYYLLEAIRGKPLSAKISEIGLRVGFIILMGLMALALYNDFVRFIFKPLL